MSDNQTEQKPTNELTAAEQKKKELVNFVANNILNGLTLNQTINVVQQVAMRDAETIVTEADEAKLKEIEDAYAKAVAAASGAQAPAEEAPAKPAAKKSTRSTKSRKSSKKAAAAWSMRSIKLDVKSRTQGGVAHTNLIIDGQDVGALYLDSDELELIAKAFRDGSRNSNDIMFEQLEPDDAEFEYDPFDD